MVDLEKPPRMEGEFRPVAIVALSLTLIPLAVSLYFLLHPSSFFYLGRLWGEAFFIPVYFFLFVNGLNVIMCIGVLRRRPWGYRLLRILLYAMLFGFPIGTLVSYATLSYIRRHRIEEHFGLPVSRQVFPRWLVVAFSATVVIVFLWMMLAY